MAKGTERATAGVIGGGTAAIGIGWVAAFVGHWTPVAVTVSLEGVGGPF